ncbi:MAG: type II secretion system F family protein [Candidatus Nanopelagicaceae bacterium]
MKRFFALVLILIFSAIPLSASAADKPSIIFIIDVSGSMRGEKLQTTKEAVTKVIENFKLDQPVGIVAFNQSVKLVQEPTIDHLLINQKISQLIASGETSLFDAVKFTLGLQIPGGISQIILLGDGEDTTSKLKFDALIQNVTDRKITINSIGVQVTTQQGQVLQDISTSSGGQFYKVDNIALLIETYKKILQEQITPVQSKSPEPTKSIDDSVQLINYLFGVLGFLLCLFLLVNIRRREYLKKVRENRINSLLMYSSLSAKRTRDRLKALFAAYSFVPKKIEIGIKNNLETIHSNVKYETVVNLIISGWFISTLMFFILAKNFLISALFAIIATYFGFRAIINNIKSKQSSEFDAELPEMLNLLSSALRSGLSLNQGLEAYVADSNNEVARQIRRANSEVKLGTPIEDALLNVATRMESEDLKWAVTALSIQRVVGGSMASILTTTYETIKSRSEIRREVKTLSAEGRLSAYVLMALPIGIFFFLFLTRREYAMVFFTNPLGILLLIIAFVMLSVGWRWIKTIVNIKI